MKLLNNLLEYMLEYERGEARRFQHLLRVHEFARVIGEGEKLDKDTQLIVEAAAIVHDIGIKPAMEKYGKAMGVLQEKEGELPAKTAAKAAGFDEKVSERIGWLVAHHHTYAPIGGIDHQILLEADYLVNHLDGNSQKENAYKEKERFFRTATGIKFLDTMFDL